VSRPDPGPPGRAPSPGPGRRPQPAPAATRPGRLVERARLAWNAAGPAAANSFGLVEAALGFIAGVVLGSLALSLYASASGRPASSGSLPVDLISLGGLWAGLVGGTLVATIAHLRPVDGRVVAGPAGWWDRFATDYGVAVRPWPDLVLGPLVGVASQYALVPLLELPLAPFVHSLSQQVGKPAEQLTSHVAGPGLLVLALFVCLGSPVVEELFFRGLLLRALLGSTARLTSTLRVVVSIAVSSLLFALAHFEAIQFLGLAGFGAVLGVMAWRTGRLGMGMAAHASFNAVAIVAIVLSR
jgi:membrane protease YdiL (CAAX protease family)